MSWAANLVRKLTLKKSIFASAASAIAAAALIYYLHQDCPASFISFFENNLRNNLFAGFLSVSALMLSLKTFIIVKLKEHVYDSKGYEDLVKKHRNMGITVGHYTPLKKLSDLLFYSILFSIITASSQLTLGLFGNWWLNILCCSLAVFTILLLTFSLLIIKSSLDDMFSFLEEEKSKSKYET